MTPQLSTVFCVRDRDQQRIRNCFRTLRAQQACDVIVEIILVDYGSAPAFAPLYPPLADEFGAQVIVVPWQRHFSRSHALNIGIRHTDPSSDFILASDIDMLFAPDFLSILTAELAAEPRGFVTSGHWALPREAITPETDVVRDFEALCTPENLHTYRHWPGPCLSATRDWYFEVRGFDERFIRYGPEDGDLVRRARRSGLAIRWISDRTHMLHQWHPTQWEYVSQFGSEDIRQQGLSLVKNIARLRTSRTIRRNAEDRWGIAPENSCMSSAVVES